MDAATPLVASPEWQALRACRRRNRAVHLRDFFTAEPDRGTRMALDAAGLHFNYARQRIDADGLELLLRLARACALEARIEALFSGAAVNATEQRPALHTALRLPPGAVLEVGGTDVAAEVERTLERMRALAVRVRSGAFPGATGAPIRHVVNIGIGGSDLGPALAVDALAQPEDTACEVRFLSSIDPEAFALATRDLDPARTAFIICSKSFGTAETLMNAGVARAWLRAALGAAGDAHLLAVTARPDAAAALGVAPEQVFPLPEWVGGRYSLPSAVGLALMLAIGPERFAALLRGLHAMDAHFRSAPPARNLPLLHGLLGIWNNNFLGAQTQAVLPYSVRLARLPAYLQQLAMESNGKRVRDDALGVDYDTGAVWWGSAGTNGQHSFHQLLLQGTRLVPCDFIGFRRGAAGGADDPRQRQLLANMIAQGEALAFGRDAATLRAAGVPAALAAHQACPGNQPSNTLLADALTPESFGALIALYEHSTFVQGSIWYIDSFDQWGVELGKQLARDHEAVLAGAAPADAQRHDSATLALLERCRAP